MKLIYVTILSLPSITFNPSTIFFLLIKTIYNKSFCYILFLHKWTKIGLFDPRYVLKSKNWEINKSSKFDQWKSKEFQHFIVAYEQCCQQTETLIMNIILH